MLDSVRLASKQRGALFHVDDIVNLGLSMVLASYLATVFYHVSA
jgi:hypothetical protein